MATRLHEFISENDDAIKLKTRDDGRAKAWIQKVYAKYPGNDDYAAGIVSLLVIE